MKLTEKQISDFNEKQYELTEKITIFEQGVDFGERWCEAETNKRQWIKILIERINSDGFMAQGEQYSNIEFAVLVERYLKDIENVIYQEFGTYTLFQPFNELLLEYQRRVREILLKVKI